MSAKPLTSDRMTVFHAGIANQFTLNFNSPGDIFRDKLSIETLFLNPKKVVFPFP